MENKDSQREDSNLQKNNENLLEGNPFFEKPEDRPELKEAPSEEEMVSEQEEPVLEETVEEASKKPLEKDAQDGVFSKLTGSGKLKKENKKLTEELEALKSQYLRLAADFDNFRKRQSQEKEDLSKNAVCDAIKTLLPAMDSLDKAYLSFKEMDDPEKLKESFNVLYRQLQESMTKIQVVKIKTAGELFDPNYHEAVMQEETTEFSDNSIMLELQPGYMVQDKVIRASMVKVASNPAGVVQTDQPSEDRANQEEGS